jgi:hypothetical protein
LEFEGRIRGLKSAAQDAEKHLKKNPLLKHMVFQCSIFQTSAAVEDYLRLLVETWAFQLRKQNLGKKVPLRSRGYVAVRTLEESFSRYIYNQDEASISESVAAEADLWNFLIGSDQLPSLFSGETLHDGTAYPSYRNLKRLLRRVGVSEPKKSLNAALKSDAETLIEAFQSIRTAIAHSAPPALTLGDVRSRLADMVKLVGAIDRLMHKHVLVHGGPSCWT